jgi:hypothetical protein
VADGVHASADQLKPAATQAVVDRPATDSEPKELPPRH